MKKPEQFEKRVERPKIGYSDRDLAILDEKIQKNYNGFKKVADQDKFFTDNYAMSVKGNERIVFTETISTYEELQNKLSQWHEWRERREYGEKKKVEGLEEVAAKMTVKDEWNW